MKNWAQKWAQIWANYYSHIARNLNTDETHKVLCEERATQETIIQRAEEHLQGVALYYSQSTLTDPQKDHLRTSGITGEAIAKKPSQDTPNSTRELSDREI
jgi:hypothetical protein